MPSPRVLIVEDHADSRASLHRLLISKGYAVRSCGSVSEAVANLGWEPHAVLLDLMLPDGDGLAVLSHVPVGPKAPKVAIFSAAHPTLAPKDLPPSVPFFPKPLGVGQLLHWLVSAV